MITTSGGQSFDTALTITGQFSSFLRAGDGSLYLGTLAGTLYVRAPGASAFTNHPGPHFRCLGQRPGTSRLFACGDMGLDGFSVGYSDDSGQTFQRMMSFVDLLGPLTCAPVQSNCEAHWQQIQGVLGIGPVPDAGTRRGRAGRRTRPRCRASAAAVEPRTAEVRLLHHRWQRHCFSGSAGRTSPLEDEVMNVAGTGRTGLATVVGVFLSLGTGCGSSEGDGPRADRSPGLSTRTAQGTAQAVDLSTCHASVPPGQPDYGPTLYNSEADDDDCKYHVKFTATPIRRDQNVTFTVTATTLADGQPATGANIDAEVFLNDTHPAPNSGQATNEKSGGVYDVGPIKFDAAGRWTVRFHLHEDCQDSTEDSPHGHVAFYIDVP